MALPTIRPLHLCLHPTDPIRSRSSTAAIRRPKTPKRQLFRPLLFLLLLPLRRRLPEIPRRRMVVRRQVLALDAVQILAQRAIRELVAVPEGAAATKLGDEEVDDVDEGLRHQGVRL